jgi:8-oxo-dGTP pyrophosphatase MutT (NUDIX family)
MDEVVLAAGAVLWRGSGAQQEIAVVHRPRYDDWTLPKGKLHDGEELLAAATREVREETGHEPEVGAPLGTVSYQVHDPDGPYDKVVHYWSMRAVDGAFSPNREVDDLRWAAPGGAFRLLTYERDREVLQRFLDLGASER